mmetsp:Transcript_24697/g.46800  ORF Transcript_24697/g.46800 Transcript_24697/m.46800 type:complete len:257 (-) Transcript_24697:287-1057(-)
MDRDRDRAGGEPERINRAFVVEEAGPPPARSNVCYEFQRNGNCSKGDNCRFEHRREGEQERSGKRLDWMRGASVKRNPDGSIELVQAEVKKAPEEVYAAGDAGKKRKKESSSKDSKKQKRDKKKDKDKKKKKKKKDSKEKKTKKKSEKSQKRHKKDSSSSDSSSGDESSDHEHEALVDAADELPPPAEYEVERISSDDYFQKNHEFSAWLKATRGKFFTELMADETRLLFEEFKEAWNSKQLPMKMYKGITVQGRR